MVVNCVFMPGSTILDPFVTKMIYKSVDGSLLESISSMGTPGVKWSGKSFGFSSMPKKHISGKGLI